MVRDAPAGCDEPACRPAADPGRWVLLCGASGGIGRATATALTSHGFAVVGLDRSNNQAAEADLRAFRRCDLGDSTLMQTVTAELLETFGPPSAAVFTAGTYPRRPLENYEPCDILKIFADNFFGCAYLTKALLPAMIAGGGGRLIYVSSQAAATGGFDPIYAASKSALQAFMKSIAREYAKLGVLSNAVSPGPVRTAMADAMGIERQNFYRSTIPIGRFTEPEEVAEAICFLVTSRCTAINGTVLDIDGGLVRR